MPYQDPAKLPIDPSGPQLAIGSITISEKVASNTQLEMLSLILEELMEVKEALFDLATFSTNKSLRREAVQSKGTKTGRKMSSKEGVI